MLENIKLKKIIMWMVIIFPIILIFNLSIDKYFIVKNKSLFDKELLLTHVCALSFESLFSPEPKASLLGSEILKQLKVNSLEFDLTKILKVTELSDKKCQVIASLSNGNGSFELVMDKSSKYPFGYKLNELIEVEVTEKAIKEFSSTSNLEKE